MIPAINSTVTVFHTTGNYPAVVIGSPVFYGEHAKIPVWPVGAAASRKVSSTSIIEAADVFPFQVGQSVNLSGWRWEIVQIDTDTVTLKRTRFDKFRGWNEVLTTSPKWKILVENLS